MGKMFLAFADCSSSNKNVIKKIGNIEFFNLAKINQNDFLRLMNSKFKFPNKKLIKNFPNSPDYKLFTDLYKCSAWGMMVPHNHRESFGSIYIPRMITHLYTAKPLICTFSVTVAGPWIMTRKLAIDQRAQFHSEDKSLMSKRFLKFYKEIYPVIQGTNWNADEVTQWDNERWRVHLALVFFDQLFEYYNKKPVTTWPKECSEIVTLIETIFSVHKSDYGQTLMMQRVEVLLGDFYGKAFKDVKQDLKDLFDYRNKFIHGKYFLTLKKKVTTYPDNSNMAQLPSVDMRLLFSLELIVRDLMVAYLYLLKYFHHKSNRGNIMLSRVILEAVMDIQLREKIQFRVNRILRLTHRER
ncbi:MAG: hypothetical protein PHW95_02555 [Patescibacteria group bacterium]|nr:hypothetical protein [Patescibacteria group bacterium]